MIALFPANTFYPETNLARTTDLISCSTLLPPASVPKRCASAQAANGANLFAFTDAQNLKQSKSISPGAHIQESTWPKNKAYASSVRPVPAKSGSTSERRPGPRGSAIIAYVVLLAILKGPRSTQEPRRRGSRSHAQRRAAPTLLLANQIDYSAAARHVPKARKGLIRATECSAFDSTHEEETIRNYRERGVQCESSAIRPWRAIAEILQGEQATRSASHSLASTVPNVSR